MRLHRILYFLVLISSLLHAQTNRYWYFGRNAGLDFNPGGALPIPSVFNYSTINSNEASASMSDDNGNILFYTNGETVWTYQHSPMFNGTNIGGHISSCQVLIIPQIGNDSLYYIFTTDAIENNFQAGYQYSIVNTKRGTGEVVSKNNVLWPSCTERLTAARHANGIDVWVITNDRASNTFRAWLVTCNGISATPVVSTAGAVLNGSAVMNTGVMKVSPNGRMLVQTHFPDYDEITNPPNFFQLFDFDNATGIISNTRTIGFPATNTEYTHAEFSPDSRLLYVTRPYEKKIDQFDLTTPTNAAIIASRTTFSTTAGFFAIQTGPDGRIYLAYPSLFLGAINSPNVVGAGCNLVERQIDVTPGNVYLGLPSFINDGLAPPAANNSFTYTILDSCTGQVQFSGSTTMAGTLTWEWDFGDGNTSSQQNPVHTFNPANQAYTVKFRVLSSTVCGYVQRTAIVRPNGVSTHIDFEIVNRCDSGYVRFVNKTVNPQDLRGQLTWHFGDGGTSTALHPVYTYAQSGVYSVKLLYTDPFNPCFNDSMVSALDLQQFQITVPPDQTIMIGQTVQLFANGTATSFEWSPTTGLSDPLTRNPKAMPLEDMVYVVKATNADGCIVEDSVKITVLQYDDIYVPTAFTPNNDGKNDFIKPFFGNRFSLSEFSVFTRWGQKIFATRERGKGWDGKINGALQNAGVYVWELRALDKLGAEVTRKGTFVLIR